ncbi:DUF4340 domain-containing protein [Candidatus Poribacteria bacterium]|nr:DUF4340 domain-containing protein [Candidatus Poribacteria bacterium]
MSYKRTLVLFLLFLALAGSYYFYEYKGKASREESEKQGKLLLPFKLEDATALVLKKAGETILAEKKGDKWVIREPIAAPAEQKTVEQALRALSELKYERELGAQTDLKPFGLGEPEMGIEIQGTHGDIGKLLLGAATPDGANLYAKKAEDQKVYTVAASVKASIDRTLFDLRDKSVFDFAVPDVKGLAVSLGDKVFMFEAVPKDDWQMTTPEKHPADSDRIRTLLDSVKYARAQKFVEEEAPDMDKYGLSSPRGRIELAFSDGKKALLLGKETGVDASAIYARRDGQRQVFELSSEMIKQLSANVGDWRDKHLARFDTAAVARLRIDQRNGRIELERSSESSGEWRLVEPQTGKADKEKAETLLSDLLEVKAARFLKASESKPVEAVLANPLVQLTLSDKNNGTLAQLSLSKLEGKSEVYAKTSRLTDLSTVSEQLLAKLSIKPEDLRDKSVLAFDPAAIQKIEVTTKDKSFVIKRKGTGWKVPGSLKMEPYDADQFLWDLRDLKYRAVTAAAKNDKTYGFDSPTRLIKLWTADEKKPVRLLIGKHAPEKGIYYVQGADDKQVMEIEALALSRWLEKF